MNTLQLRTFFVLLTLGVGTSTAWSSHNELTTSVAESHANMPKGATPIPGNNADATNHRLPGIVDEEEIPAFLITDPCDTGDS